MALAIATNNAALNAAASASSVNRDMETSMARLSSGKRINSASDDAAGVAIASRLSAEIRGTDQAIRNSMDGQALIDTAEGAHKEIENILQRMREVAVQAANDTNNDQDRANLQAEMNAMIIEIDRIASTTTWAGENLMKDSETPFSFQVGTATGSQNQIEITIDAMGSTALGLSVNTDTVGSTVTKLNGTISVGVDILGTENSDDPIVGTDNADVIYGLDGDDIIVGNGGDDKIIISNGKNGVYGDAGADHYIIIDNNGLAEDNPSSQTGYFGAQLFDFSASEDIIAINTSVEFKYVEEVYANVAAGDIWNYGATIASELPSNENRIVFFTGEDLSDNSLDGFIYIHSPDDAGIDGSYINLDKITSAPSLSNFVSGNFNISINGTNSSLSRSLSAASFPPLDTLPNAMAAIKSIDEAIKTVNIQRSELGAVSNRLSHTVNNLTNISANLSAALGGIEDADFALETTDLAKDQILQQASTAMLAQANASKQNVLSLLQG